MIKKIFFSSSFLHISEGVAEVKPSLGLLGTAFEKLGNIVKWVKGLANSMYEVVAKGANWVADASRTAFNKLKDSASWAWSKIKKMGRYVANIGNKEKVVTINKLPKMNIKQAEDRLRAMGVSDLMLKKARGANNQISKIHKDLLKPIGVKIMEASAARGKETTPVYTVQFGAKMASNREVKMLTHLGEMSIAMKEMLKKQDPNNARTAEALEQINDRQSKKPKFNNKSERIQKASGEAMNDWWSD